MKTCNSGPKPYFHGKAHKRNHTDTFSIPQTTGPNETARSSVGEIRRDLSGQSLDELVRMFHDTGNKMAFSEIYRRFSSLVLGSCINFLKDSCLAKDAASDIFLHIHDKLRTVRPVAFRAWLYSVSRNHCLQVLRSAGRAPRLEPLSELKGAAEPRSLATEKERHPALKAAVAAALGALPERQRDCIKMFLFQNLRYKEISEETGWELKEVKSHIQNGKRNLRRALGGQWKAHGFAG